jgi:hypothetical protein
MWHIWGRRTYRVLVRKHEGKNHLEGLSVDEYIALKEV